MAEVEASGATAEEAGTSAPAPGQTPRELAADLNLRLAQLGWPVYAKLVADPQGREDLIVRPYDTDRPAAPGATTLHVGAASLGRPGLVDALLSEIRSRGWDRLPPTSGRPNDVLWCAPQ